jgi:hypothetical protein
MGIVDDGVGSFCSARRGRVAHDIRTDVLGWRRQQTLIRLLRLKIMLCLCGVELRLANSTCEDKIFEPPREALRTPEFVETERRSRPAHARQQPTDHPLVGIASAALKFVLLDGLPSQRPPFALPSCRFSFGSAIHWRRSSGARDLPWFARCPKSRPQPA